jgi:hypothetical protein
MSAEMGRKARAAAVKIGRQQLSGLYPRQQAGQTVEGMETRQPSHEHSLSKLLKPFSLRPKKMRIGGNPTRGYVPVKILEAAERYVKEEADEVEEDVEDVPM